MPNWCECKLTVTGLCNELERLFIEGADDKQPLSLEKLVPIPKEVRGTSSGSADIGYDALYGSDKQVKDILAYPWVEVDVKDRAGLIEFLCRTNPSWIEEGKRQKRALDATGFRNWYDWRITNWGTKWDLSDVRPSKVQIKPFDVVLRLKSKMSLDFNTAWAPPIEAFDTIAEKFSSLTFKLSYWEGGGGFRGVALWRAGTQVYNHVFKYKGNRGG